ncbi:MAG: hypothetical protein K2X38_10820 [Gemmataceae bacterium]|nr:hypothetical protein [Gemmataceae bacterium]
MGLDQIPAKLRSKYSIDERENATAILAADFPVQFQDILDCLEAFALKKSYIVEKGGSKSPVSIAIDGFLQGTDSVLRQLEQGKNDESEEPSEKLLSRSKKKGPIRPPIPPIGDPAGRGWKEKKFDIDIFIDKADDPIPVPTHKIDNYKRIEGELRGIGLEVEWNNKDPFFDRDLNNFRLLRAMGVLSVGVIVTRCTELQSLFNKLGKGKSYGNSTTHLEKLIPKVDSGAAGGCPLLIIGMGLACYDENS